MPSQIVTDCSKSLAEKKLTVAFAESATSGRLAFEFSMCPDSGKVLKGGLVCYDADLKKSILHVPESILEEFTPESAEVTKEIAERLKSLIPADIHVGVTGLTTPGGSESPEKPVGTIFMHACIQERSIAAHEVFEGEPEEMVLQCIDRIAELILQEVAYDRQVAENAAGN